MLNYSMLTNEQLFKCIADKDRGVIKFVYDKYSPTIYGIILNEIRIKKEADSILYDTFITCFLQPGNDTSKTSMFINLRNIAISIIRKERYFTLAGLLSILVFQIF